MTSDRLTKLALEHPRIARLPKPQRDIAVQNYKDAVEDLAFQRGPEEKILKSLKSALDALEEEARERAQSD